MTTFNPSGTVFASTPTENKPKGRGFASMDPARQKEIASQGGRASHARGTAHRWTSEEARAAGRKRADNIRAKKLAAENNPDTSGT